MVMYTSLRWYVAKNYNHHLPTNQDSTLSTAIQEETKRA